MEKAKTVLLLLTLRGAMEKNGLLLLNPRTEGAKKVVVLLQSRREGTVKAYCSRNLEGRVEKVLQLLNPTGRKEEKTCSESRDGKRALLLLLVVLILMQPRGEGAKEVLVLLQHIWRGRGTEGPIPHAA